MKPRIDLSTRPPGISSRLRQESATRSSWVADNGQAVPLPAIIDYLHKHRDRDEFIFYIEARIDLVEGQPELVDCHLYGNPCLDPVHLQRFFRWATPLEIIRMTVPQLLAKGIDPYSYEYAIDGYPDTANIERKSTHALSDAFLRDIAEQYLKIGHGYARTIAAQRGVSPRTVVNWVQKARKKGFLAPTTPGKRGRA